MIKVKTKQTGSRLHKLDALARRMAAAGDAVARSGAEMVKAEALALLEDGEFPDTDIGELARSLHVEKVPGGYAVTSNAPHAWFAEFGTLARPSAGWLGRAAGHVLPGFKPLAARLLQQAIRSAVRQNNGASQ